ncbi:hypothetical protein C8R44DRAFT_776096 [Mycena epipterygia]|nr:hypothetical protein C8R44DRAFT_776096 [Mycena epipterygia]
MSDLEYVIPYRATLGMESDETGIHRPNRGLIACPLCLPGYICPILQSASIRCNRLQMTVASLRTCTACPVSGTCGFRLSLCLLRERFSHLDAC